MISKIGFRQAKEILDSSVDSIMFDVRDEEEFITGHPDCAVLFPLSEINEKTASDMINGFETNILVYCRSGKRSAEASILLDNLGYKNIYDLGSLIGWPYGIV